MINRQMTIVNISQLTRSQWWCVLGRFDGYEVLGDRVSISWYKDVRKARAYGKTGDISVTSMKMNTMLIYQTKIVYKNDSDDV